MRFETFLTLFRTSLPSIFGCLLIVFSLNLNPVFAMPTFAKIIIMPGRMNETAVEEIVMMGLKDAMHIVVPLFSASENTIFIKKSIIYSVRYERQGLNKNMEVILRIRILIGW